MKKIIILIRYKQAALGGTFDLIHIGHLKLLKKAFDISNFVVIGVTSDEFVNSVLHKKIHNNYSIRVDNLQKCIESHIQSSSYKITKLNDSFGPLAISNDIDCLVVSSETLQKGKSVNSIRKNLGLLPIDVVSVDMVLAEDGLPVSSSRIRSNEIDDKGFKINK